MKGWPLVKRARLSGFMKIFTSTRAPVKRIADSVRRLSMYLRYLEDLDAGQQTASSDELAHLAGRPPGPQGPLLSAHSENAGWATLFMN